MTGGLPTHGSLTHWGRVTHICVGNLTIIGSDNGLSPGRRQAIIRTNPGILLIGPLGTKFCEILAEIITFSFKKMYLKVSSAKWRPFCIGLDVLMRKAFPWCDVIMEMNFVRSDIINVSSYFAISSPVLLWNSNPSLWLFIMKLSLDRPLIVAG